ncbi:uncharacterized protein yc1106_03811 [Curvularia clavata]|uniref:Protein prenyltransferase n=1 Tax=Curvularia clavata TaxID=95742 RepID=A0A9Q9DRD3_CURCL|nr:uncharacterized protein yc1106_03811 [Curvularia clavata]
MEPDVPQRSELQKLAYASLTRYFQDHENEVVEIEILPPGVQPPDGVLMHEGLHLGVSKKALVLAFMEARQQFFTNKHSNDPSTIDQTMRATEIMLLFDPEHITAANYRKCELARLKAEHGLHTGNICHTSLQRELRFLNSILTSPLHRQSKSPTLWYHRAYVVDSLISVELAEAANSQKMIFWKKELDAVCKSGEQHPRNYHAWQYARRLVQKARSFDFEEHFARNVKTWCCRHPSDISGWSFLLYLMPQIALSLKQELLRDVFNYAVKLDIKNESLWVFMRTALVEDLSSTGHLETYQRLQVHAETLRADKRLSTEYESILHAVQWVETYRTDTG